MLKVHLMEGFTDKLRGALKRSNTQPLANELRRPNVLQCPQIPKPMHGLAPRVILGRQWWDKVRKEAYASTNWHCIACGVHKSKARFHKWLEGHELYLTDYRKGLLVYVETIPLCHACHNYIHIGRLEILMNSGEIPAAKYTVIVRHGDKVLREAGLFRPDVYDGPCAEWSKWRLDLDGTLHKPRFKNYEAWERHYGRHT